MATIAIDPNDVRHSHPAAEFGQPARARKAFFIAGGVAVGIAAIAGGAAMLSSMKFPGNLSGLAFLPKPEAPRRSEIRIGRLPDMPEIRNGVPEIVGTRPVRVIDTASATPVSFGPKSVESTKVPAAAVPTATLPTTFTSVSSARFAPADEAPFRPRAEAASTKTELPSSASPVIPATTIASAAGPVSASLTPPPAEMRAAPEMPVAKPEPVSTASVPDAMTSVPLPPPAPVRTAAAPRAIEGRPDKPARPAQVVARQASAQPSPNAAEAAPSAPPEDRIEVLGVKLPNGRDVRDAVSSIGEALNLPKVF